MFCHYCGKQIKDILSVQSAGKFAFKMMMLAGYIIGFGTSDTFNRYQEIKSISDVAGAIIKVNSRLLFRKIFSIIYLIPKNISTEQHLIAP